MPIITKVKYILYKLVRDRWFVFGEFDDPIALASAAFALGKDGVRNIRIDKEGEIDVQI